MSPESQQILEGALMLPPTERAELVERLLQSFEFPARKEIDEAWAQEVENRIDAYDRGELKSVSAADVFEEIDRQVDA